MAAPRRCLAAVGLSVLALAGALGPAVASAAPTPPAPTPSTSTSYRRDPADFSLTLSPTRLTIGQRDIGSTQQITLINRGQAAMDITAQKRNFTVGSDGALRYMEDAPYAASSWVTVSPEQFHLEPGRAQVVRATVQAPEVHEPGDHQMALVFVVPAGKSDGNIRVNRGVGLPVYITAPGEVVDSVSLSGLAAPRFASGGTVPVTATVTNSGTIHHDFRKPSPLTVGGAGSAEPFPDFTVPRGSVRDIATTWNPPFLCICHPTVTMTSANGGTQTQTVRVVVFPWPWFAGALALVLLVLFLTRLAKMRYRASVARAAAVLAAPVSGDDG
jgi:hypothetical protein